MSPKIDELLFKSQRSFEAAKELLHHGDPDFAASRAYYAMFYAAEALLLTKELSFSRHKALISGLHEHFVKPGLIDQELHQAFHKAFNHRQTADYSSTMSVDIEQAKTILSNTEKMLKAVRSLIAKGKP